VGVAAAAAARLRAGRPRAVGRARKPEALTRLGTSPARVEYDLAIVGGGIVGAGVARDAALRGLKVALVEREDFGSGTTSRSTRLIHGGLRYLAHFDFPLVHEALRERRTLLRNAPHLVRPVPFLLPVYAGQGHPVPVLWAGMVLYDFLVRRRGVPHHRHLPRDRCLRLEPRLRPEGLRGGFLFHDGQCNFPERLCLENVLDAADHGADLFSHTRVVAFEQDGHTVTGVRVRGELTGEERTLRARIVLNCSGPWLDEVERLVDPQAPPRLRRTKGVHLVVPRLAQHALIFESRDAARVLFAIPWREYTLLGTTDTDYEGANEDVRTEPEDQRYLLDELARVMDVRLQPSDVLFTMAGLRPLQRDLKHAAAAVTRREKIIDHEAVGGRRGLVTVVGGKITTYRAIAQLVVDFVQAKLGYARAACLTAKIPLPGGRLEGPWDHFLDDLLRAADAEGVEADVARHLADHYGAEAFALVEAVHVRPELGRRLLPGLPWIWAQVEHAVVQERALTLADVLLRRLAVGLSRGQGRAVAPDVARFLAERLGWDAARVASEVADYEARLERNWPADVDSNRSP
jgi:glycerol-3-phosphate dehydrogenase